LCYAFDDDDNKHTLTHTHTHTHTLSTEQALEAMHTPQLYLVGAFVDPGGVSDRVANALLTTLHHGWGGRVTLQLACLGSVNTDPATGQPRTRHLAVDCATGMPAPACFEDRCVRAGDASWVREGGGGSVCACVCACVWVWVLPRNLLGLPAEHVRAHARSLAACCGPLPQGARAAAPLRVPGVPARAAGPHTRVGHRRVPDAPAAVRRSDPVVARDVSLCIEQSQLTALSGVLCRLHLTPFDAARSRRGTQCDFVHRGRNARWGGCAPSVRRAECSARVHQPPIERCQLPLHLSVRACTLLRLPLYEVVDMAHQPQGCL
jgi:hypothetical protein